jgi:DNA-directed RNA polymerase subunit RPC12/RpoP
MGQLKCPYCAWTEVIPQTAAVVEERSYEQYLKIAPSQTVLLSTQALEVDCTGCQAKITFEPPETAGKCPFCGTGIVVHGKTPHPTLAPESLLPCTVSPQDARAKVRKWLESRWFAPNALKQLAQQEGLQGVYLPFWTYDSHTISHYTGARGEHYYVTETYTTTDADGKSVTETREVQRTRWHSVAGTVTRFFDDVLIPATQQIAPEQLEKLAPWNLAKLVPYDAAYLAGFKAQRYQVTLAEGFGKAKGKMVHVIDSDVRRDIGGDEQRVNSVSTAYNAITFKHILLPVWLSAYRYRNQQYQVMVNAQTGQVLGDRPYSVVKITLAVVGVLAIVVGGVVLFNHLKSSNHPSQSSATRVIRSKPINVRDW